MENSKIKICFFVYSTVGGGSEKISINIANNLDRNQFDIFFIYCKHSQDYAGLIKKDIHITDLGYKNDSRNPFLIACRVFQITKMFKRIRPNIIFCNNPYVNVLSIMSNFLFRIKAKVIIRERNLEVTRLKQKETSLRGLLSYKLFYPLADMLIAPTQSILDDFNRIINFHKLPIKVIPNFIDETSILNTLNSSHNTTEMNLKMDKPIIISSGRLEHQKNYETAIRTIGLVNKNFPCYYWILGKGSQEERLRKLAQELHIENSVLFLGFQKNPFMFLQKANIFFLPSVFEGFPNALLEAMYFRLPSVVSRFNSSVEDIIRDGKEGFILEKDDITGMAERIKNILTDNQLSQELSNNAKQRINLFKKEVVMPQYHNLFFNATEQEDKAKNFNFEK